MEEGLVNDSSGEVSWSELCGNAEWSLNTPLPDDFPEIAVTLVDSNIIVIDTTGLS